MSLRLRRLFSTETLKSKISIFSSLNIALVLLPVMFSQMNVESVESSAYKNDLKLASNKPSVLEIKNTTSQIVPGESKVQKEAREAAEAAAKAQAEARAKAEADAKRNVVSREKRVYNDPSNFDAIYARAASTYGVDARLIKAVHLAETGGSGSTGLTNRSGSGAQGPMQFMPSTWKRNGVDGNGDGIADINNVEDAIFAGARYLKVCGYPDVKKALWGYNPSQSYYNKVTRIAGSLGN